MGKNGSAAKGRGGDKAQDLTSPDASGSATNGTTTLDQGAADGQKGDAGSSGSTSQADKPPAPNPGATSSQAAGPTSTGASGPAPGNIQESVSQAGEVSSASFATGWTLTTGTQLVGESGHELRLDLSKLGNRDASSDKSNTDAAAGTGESFGKMLADSFRSTAGLKVTSSQAGFRRAGRAWNTTPTVIALSELTGDQVKLLQGEPMLTVELVDLEDEDA
jgi:hypothetical protein